MNNVTLAQRRPAWQRGLMDAIPLLGGYVPVAISFGLIASQAGFSALEATLISLLIYAGASQFLLVAMVAGGAPLWLATVMTLLVNLRHAVYAPILVPHMSKSKAWPWLVHGLTDQIFALAHTRFSELNEQDKVVWFTTASLFAWASWVTGTAVGALAGDTLTSQWPLLDAVMPFALPALFLVLLAPRFSDATWCMSLLVTILSALVMVTTDARNVAVPFAAICGGIAFYAISHCKKPKDKHHEN